MTAIPITYAYKVYRAGAYLGDLPNVISPFNYALDINNGAAPLTVECQVNLVTASDAITTIDTEIGTALQAEDGSNLEIERQPEVFGASGSGKLIANDNVLVVYEFSSDYPNGKKVFSGWMTNWHIQHKANKVVINCISYGMDLNDYVAGNNLSPDVTQNTQDASVNMYYNSAADFVQYGQEFQVGASITSMGAISLWLAGNGSPVTVTLKLYNYITDELGGATPLATATQIVTSATPQLYQFVFATPATVSHKPAQIYDHVLTLAAQAGAGIVKVYYKGSDVYAGGKMTTYGAGFGAWTETPSGVIPAADLYFITYSRSSNTTAIFSSTDPTTMATTIIDTYRGQGGQANYAAGTTTATGLSVTYTFILSRVVDAIKKLLDLSPANFYWTVDPATTALYFKSYNTTADILLVLGQNIDDVDIGVNAEGVRNQLYFSGGPTAGVNLLKAYSNSASVATVGRQRLELLQDNRVTLSTTADAIASAFFGANATEIYETTVTIARAVLDITTILPGQTVGFSGFGNFVDSLILVVQRVERHPEYVTLNLGSIPPRATSVLKDIQNHVDDLETLANPSTPS